MGTVLYGGFAFGFGIMAIMIARFALAYLRKKGDSLGIWREWGDDVRGHAIKAGHFFPEEAFQATFDALNDFFGGVSQSRGAVVKP